MSGERGTSERVAAVLAARIEAGELAPGERLPSTRAIVAEFGVAMATATRVLALLRAAGAARTLPGVGTVVAPGAQRAAPGAPATAVGAPLLAAAAERAVAVADAEGLAAVTLRRLATDLGAAPMSLHRLLGGKDGLLRHMSQHAVSRAPWPPAAGDWRARAGAGARALWDTFRRHPWLAATTGLMRPTPFPAGLDYTEWMLAAFADAGLDPQRAFGAHLAVFSTLRGFAIDLEADADATARTGQDLEQWSAAQEAHLRAVLAGRPRPHLAAVVEDGFDLDLDALALGAVAQMLDGLAVPPR